MNYRWSNPNHCVNTRERMRHTALHVLAKKQGNYEGMWQVAQASFEPWTEGEWRTAA